MNRTRLGPECQELPSIIEYDSAVPETPLSLYRLHTRSSSCEFPKQ